MDKRIGTLKNRRTYNPLNDDLTAMNYLALAYCITGVKDGKKRKYPSISRICSSFKLFDKLENGEIVRTGASVADKKYTKTWDKEKVVINIKTREVREFKENKEISNALGIHSRSIGTYIRKKSVYDSTYLILLKDGIDVEKEIEICEEKFKTKLKCKKVKLINIKTNEIKMFESVKDAASFLEVKPCYVSGASTGGFAMKKEWKAEIVG